MLQLVIKLLVNLVENPHHLPLSILAFSCLVSQLYVELANLLTQQLDQSLRVLFSIPVLLNDCLTQLNQLSSKSVFKAVLTLFSLFLLFRQVEL